MEKRNCTSCEGTGRKKAWVQDGKEITPERECYSCKGGGTFDPPVIPEIIEKIKGRKEGTLRSSMRSYDSNKGILEARSYYVWRMARFHGGKDVTLPIMGILFVDGDPFKEELDTISEKVAIAVFGTDLGAVSAWGRVLA
jgi:hypothetical protein